MAKIFEIVRPKSLTNSDYEDFEYLIRWIGRDGSEYLYMFYDATIKNNINSEVINQDSTTLIKSLIKSVGTKVVLTASDLTKNDLTIIQQIFENPIVWRIKTDDTEEPFAPEANSFNYELMQGVYEIEFTIVKANTKTWR